ncbi:MAG: porin, partial [Planctomycetota bacterium]
MIQKKGQISMTVKLETRTCALLMLAVAVFGSTATGTETGNELEATRQEVKELKQTVHDLAAEVERLKGTSPETSPPQGLDSALGKLHFGGYGEMHANFVQGSESDQFDIHRLVLYLGYDFADWIKFNSEIEIEHAYVTDGDGEVVLEQAYVDFLLTGRFNVRAGRILTPIGIINKKHEPTTFNGVERPAFATNIIPTTWSSDGLGIFGSLSESLTYEAYVVGGLDGSMFTATSGIRNGRIKERPSLNEPAITARLDYYPCAAVQNDSDQSLRLGA